MDYRDNINRYNIGEQYRNSVTMMARYILQARYTITFLVKVTSTETVRLRVMATHIRIINK